VIDPGRREARLGGKTFALTATEFRLLHLLAAHPGRVYSRAELVDAVLGREAAVIDRTIDVHITGLRKKMGGSGDRIETVRGFGYRFREPED
jgi:two-component system phosphate regulon response regulator PhoB